MKKYLVFCAVILAVLSCNNDSLTPESDPPLPAAAPVFSLEPGSYDGPVEISITCESEGAMIFYTTDGTDPMDLGSYTYNDGNIIYMSEPTTVKAFAKGGGWGQSELVTGEFTMPYWKAVGDPGFTPEQARDIVLAFDSSDTPFVAYHEPDNGYKASVMKYDGSSWVQVGSRGFSNYKSLKRSFAIDTADTLYLSYIEPKGGNDDDRWGIVKYFDGADWTDYDVDPVSGYVSTERASDTSLAIGGGEVPYVVFKEGSPNQLEVMRHESTDWSVYGDGITRGADYPYQAQFDPCLAFNTAGTVPYAAYGTSSAPQQVWVVREGIYPEWEDVGSLVFEGEAGYINLAVDSKDTVYAAFTDSEYNIKVKKLSGASWEDVGPANFSGPYHYELCFALDSNDIPYIAYTDLGATVKMFDGIEWITVGQEKFTDGSVSDPSLAFDSEDTPYIAYSDFLNNDAKITVRKFSR